MTLGQLLQEHKPPMFPHQAKADLRGSGSRRGGSAGRYAPDYQQGHSL